MECPGIIKKAKVKQFAKLVFSNKQIGKLKNRISRGSYRGALSARQGKGISTQLKSLNKDRQLLQNVYSARIVGAGGVAGIGSLALKKKKKK